MVHPWSRPALRAAVLTIAVFLIGFVTATPSSAGPAPTTCPPPVPYLVVSGSCEGPGANAVRSERTRPDTALTVPPAPVPNGSGRTDLPTTGPDVGGLLVLGAAMVVAGVLLVTVRRRGARSTLAPFPSDEDHVWHAPTMEIPVWHRAD